MRWALAIVLFACGARTDLSALPKHEIEDASPPPAPCFEVEYPMGKFTNTPFVLTATHVYYMKNDYDLVRVPKKGGDSEPVQTFGNDAPNGRVVVDDTSIFWVAGGGPMSGAVLSADNGGGAPQTIGKVPSFGSGAIAQNHASLVVLLDPGSFATLPKEGGAAVAIGSPSAPTGPVIDAYADNARIYWSTTEHVYGLGLAPPFALRTFGAWPTGLAVDVNNVYWTTTNDVVRFANMDDALIGGTLEGHAHGPIAVGQKAVFGVGHGGIVRVRLDFGVETLVVPDVVPNRIETDISCVYYSTTKGTLARFPQ